MIELTPAQRLIVAADFRLESSGPNGGTFAVRQRLRTFLKSLEGTGVTIKANSLLRVFGYELIREIQGYGLGVFADLKLNDISNTLKTDGEFLQTLQPEMLTVMCSAGVGGMQALKAQLPLTEVLGVTVLTSLTSADTVRMFGTAPDSAAVRFAEMAKEAGIGGLISSAAEAHLLRKVVGEGMTINAAGIRPGAIVVGSDDQNPDRARTPLEAFEAGVDRIIVGRPIVEDPNPYDATMRIIDSYAHLFA
ncbi:MAG: orotidine-5'-phosphate decarboxylase [Patescibacteria group bacterium]